MTSAQDEATPGPPGPSRDGARPHSRWWVAAITFVVGVGLGVLLVGLLRLGTPTFPTATGPTATTTPAAGSSSPAGAAAEARVNAACLRVLDEAQQISRILSGVDEATADVDLQRLDDIVRQLQPIEPRLARDLQDCRVDTSVGSGPTSSTSPDSRTPQPTPTG